MSTGEHPRPLGVDGGEVDDRVVAQAVTDVVEVEGDDPGSAGVSVASAPPGPPIVLPPSTSQDALVAAIQQASALGVPLLLEPGTHFTKPGHNQRIAIGANGLQIRPVDPPAETTHAAQPAVITRPDFSINLQAPDFNYGLFFIPAAPTSAELAGITRWKLDDSGKEPFEYAVVIRGRSP